MPSSCTLARFVYVFEGSQCETTKWHNNQYYYNKCTGRATVDKEIVRRLDVEALLSSSSDHKEWVFEEWRWQTLELNIPYVLGQTKFMAALPDKDSIYIFCGNTGYMANSNCEDEV